MNLAEYIGDTRTDSLPPGFLKSIKIKYRHEASHVFPRQREVVSRESQEKEGTSELVGECGENEEEKTDKAKIKPVSWYFCHSY